MGSFKRIRFNKRLSIKRITGQKCSLSTGNSEKSTNAFTNVYSFSPHPPIPNPSKELSIYLSTLKSSEKNHYLHRQNKFERYSKRRLNGFMAFRSYYSKKIIGVAKQREISTVLAKFWKIENHQDTWKTLALVYNSQKRNISFTDWLNITQQENENHDKTMVPSETPFNSTKPLEGTIQDIYEQSTKWETSDQPQTKLNFAQHTIDPLIVLGSSDFEDYFLC
ncbi:uncharacterized protein ASCRUDRAFT_165243 [Ascoidea rubescens DSM 1968]|uniref:Alpha box domain-containing protein n=1 Tax=Ascoidea rubescens DSM 1968 TaxID=1344418 RepID=A0A1D2V8G5_9ASCO|nr:hypothetical protein ASCRUDRAFT_165243 [Ascoidea rubescens DSM 1968]ODV57904.1 hypothetical protein ASCRUDRAFT_165243 [Ascoidea rubescens DSM 1968]